MVAVPVFEVPDTKGKWNQSDDDWLTWNLIYQDEARCSMNVKSWCYASQVNLGEAVRRVA